MNCCYNILRVGGYTLDGASDDGVRIYAGPNASYISVWMTVQDYTKMLDLFRTANDYSNLMACKISPSLQLLRGGRKGIRLRDGADCDLPVTPRFYEELLRRALLFDPNGRLPKVRPPLRGVERTLYAFSPIESTHWFNTREECLAEALKSGQDCQLDSCSLVPRSPARLILDLIEVRRMYSPSSVPLYFNRRGLTGAVDYVASRMDGSGLRYLRDSVEVVESLLEDQREGVLYRPPSERTLEHFRVALDAEAMSPSHGLLFDSCHDPPAPVNAVRFLLTMYRASLYVHEGAFNGDTLAFQAAAIFYSLTNFRLPVKYCRYIFEFIHHCVAELGPDGHAVEDGLAYMVSITPQLWMAGSSSR